jgi:peptidoglycan/LPS O-acetylase OafA/YrhL
VLWGIGAISYSLYLWQQPFMPLPGVEAAWFRTFPINLILAFAAALGSYFGIERPLRRWRARPRALPEARERLAG